MMDDLEFFALLKQGEAKCKHPMEKVTHLVHRGSGGTVCLKCLKAWPDAADGTWTGPLQGKTPTN